MLRSLRAVAIFSGALVLGAFVGTASHASPVHAGAIAGVNGPSAQSAKEGPPPPNDPNRKKEGEACKTSDECQRHHTCTKVGDNSVCQAPPRPRLPPGAVT
ncbi:MAG: hypothetical protein U1A78_20580 [Polyangia bacterium]